MEERLKKARLQSLALLRRIKNGEGDRLDALNESLGDSLDSTEKSRVATECDQEANVEEDDGFVVDDHRAFSISRVANKRSSAFSFKPSGPPRMGNTREETNLDLTASLQNDEYFQTLLHQMELDEDDSPNILPTRETKKNPTNVVTSDPPTTTVLPTSELSPLPEEEVLLPATIDDETYMMTMMMNNDWLDDVEVDGMALQGEENEALATSSLDATIDLNDKFENTNNMSIPSEGDGIQFYWIDAYERHDGTLFLFGKVIRPDSNNNKEFISACIIVQNMMRNIFFLPRETLLGDSSHEVTLGDVHAEISELAHRHRIMKFGCKKVSRRYAFEIPDVPVEAEYVKMVYPFTSPMLPKDLHNGRTFSHIFGVGTGALELFLVKRKIMGPGWLNIKSHLNAPTAGRMSWCRMEWMIDDPKAIQPILNGPPAPPLTLLSLTMRTIIEPTSKSHEVAALSGLLISNISVDGDNSIAAGNNSSSWRCSGVFSVVREVENLGFTTKFTNELNQNYRKSGPSVAAAGCGGKLEVARNERALLAYLIAMIHRTDPDVIVGHGFLGFDLGVLLHRMRACKVEFWSRLGRLNWSQWPKTKGPGSTEASYAERQIASGRLICDTMANAKDLVRSRNYTLETLVESQLGQEREDLDLDSEHVKQMFRTPSDLVQLVRHAERDAYLVVQLMSHLMILPLTKQLTSIAGNLWSRTMGGGGRAERTEYLLLHEFHRLKYICPDRQATPHIIPEPPLPGDEEGPDAFTKTTTTTAGKRRKATYAGGLVLEPKKGLYRNIVLLLDFNSLYPSIIQEFNICFTTIERHTIDGQKDESIDDDDEQLPSLPSSSTPQGVLPRILANLVARRREIKRLMKDANRHDYGHLHIRQQALKLTANSMYGCLGFAHSRFHARPLAMLITAQGRRILAETVEVAQRQCNLDVVYGDTDSVMVHTGTKDVTAARAQGMALRRAVNQRYRLLEIELEALFRPFLLLRKKKYAAMRMEEQVAPDGRVMGIRQIRETKGLDLVRRDWCPLSVDASNAVLDLILSDAEDESGVAMLVDSIHRVLSRLAHEVTTGVIPLEKFVISKNLTKDPSHYPDARQQPHVTVALRMRERGEAVRAGDTIPYVIVTDSTSASNGTGTGTSKGSGMLADHAFSPDDVRRDHLRVDKEWYLAQQVHPCVSRLCEHLPGINAASLAAALGLDVSRYQSTNSAIGAGVDKENIHQNTTDDTFTVWKVTCPLCRHAFSFNQPPLCPSCANPISPAILEWQLRQTIHHLAREYYQTEQQCDEPSCGIRTRLPRVYEGVCPQDGCRGILRPVIPGKQVYRQLMGLQRSLLKDDGEKASSDLEAVKRIIDETLNQCAYPIIDMGELFSFVTHDAGIKTYY